MEQFEQNAKTAGEALQKDLGVTDEELADVAKKLEALEASAEEAVESAAKALVALAAKEGVTTGEVEAAVKSETGLSGKEIEEGAEAATSGSK